MTTERQPIDSPRLRRTGGWLLAFVLAVAGIIAGWLVLKGVLALPLPEAALFGLTGLIAIALLACAVLWHQRWGRALLVGGFIGLTSSLLLVLLFVTA